MIAVSIYFCAMQYFTKKGYSIQNAIKVDVNEQNNHALGFYEHIGFKVVGRSPLDGQGEPYPILHMALEQI